MRPDAKIGRRVDGTLGVLPVVAPPKLVVERAIPGAPRPATRGGRGYRCRHAWEMTGPAPSFRGERCRLWRCQACGQEWELFYDVVPKGAVTDG